MERADTLNQVPPVDENTIVMYKGMHTMSDDGTRRKAMELKRDPGTGARAPVLQVVKTSKKASTVKRNLMGIRWGLLQLATSPARGRWSAPTCPSTLAAARKALFSYGARLLRVRLRRARGASATR